MIRLFLDYNTQGSTFNKNKISVMRGDTRQVIDIRGKSQIREPRTRQIKQNSHEPLGAARNSVETQGKFG